MLSPKRTKFRKAHKGRIHGVSKGGTQLNFGAYGLKALTPERVTARQSKGTTGYYPSFVVLGASGYVFFLTCLSHQNLLRCEWVKERGHQNIGWLG